MAVLPQSMLWRRLDTAGTDHALLRKRSGLYARGTMVAAEPVPHTCGYELVVDEGWVSVRLAVTAEGAGWWRSVKLERAAGRWLVTASEQGDLDAAGQPRSALPGIEDPELLRDALDVDLAYCLLTNTPPVRRLGLLHARPGTASVSWAVRRKATVVPGPISARCAPTEPFGMPTLPGFTTSRRSTSRTNGMCVCPHTTVVTVSSTVDSAARRRAIELSTSTNSSSSRGVAWQNSVDPNPATSSVTVNGSAARRSR